jgi:hypothetical protein
VHSVSDVRQTEVPAAEPIVPDSSPSEVEIANAKFRKCKLPGSDQIPADVLQAGLKPYYLRSINSLLLFGMRRNCLISGRSLLLYQFTKHAIKLPVVVIMGYTVIQYFIQYLLPRLSPYTHTHTHTHTHIYGLNLNRRYWIKYSVTVCFS